MQRTELALLAGVVLIASPALASLGAQETLVPEIHMAESPGAAVAISQFSEAQFPVFKGLLKGEDAALQSASFVLTNTSDKAIFAISAEWLLTGRDGRERRWSFHSDNFMFPKAGPVLKPHDKLFVAPGLFVPASTVGNPGVSGDMSAGLGRELGKAARVEVVVDCLIFEDGELLGPNKRGYSYELQTRKQAAEAVVQAVIAAQQKGEPPSRAVGELSAAKYDRGDFINKCKTRFAKGLLNAPNFQAELSRLQDLPSPPKLYRSNGGTL